MPRSPRIEYPHAIYHVLARGNRRGAIVLDDNDRWMLIRTLGEMATRTGILVHSYALMDNHYHFVIETPRGNLIAGMQWFQTTYTQRFNAKNGLWWPSVRRALQGNCGARVAAKDISDG